MTMMTAQNPILNPLEARVAVLEDLVFNLPRLCCKEVMNRYGISKSTFYRWLRSQRLPRPVRMGGPRWRLGDLVKAEQAGKIPHNPALN